MGKRVSHSVLDPLLTTRVKKLYPALHIPRALPPEGIILVGFICAVGAGLGFANLTAYAWGGIVAALGVAGNHIADVFDGTHARATNQCRNGGELLDHFTDPLSFALYISGLGYACGRLDLGLAGVICIYATSVLTNIKAKMIGEFTIASFGPTEFKTLLVIFGVGMSILHVTASPELCVSVAFWFLAILLAVGVVQLLVNLVLAVRQVNQSGNTPDTTEWIVTRKATQ